jgi:hypothetical protein
VAQVDGELILGGRVRLLAVLPADAYGPVWQGVDQVRGQYVIVRELVGANAQHPLTAPGHEVVVDAGRVFVLIPRPQAVPAPPAAPPSRRRWWIIGGVAAGLVLLLCLVLVAVGAVYLVNHRPTPPQVTDATGPGVNVGALGAKKLDCIRVDEVPKHADDEVHARIVSEGCRTYVVLNLLPGVPRDQLDSAEAACRLPNDFDMILHFVLWVSTDGETGTIYCMGL